MEMRKQGQGWPAIREQLQRFSIHQLKDRYEWILKWRRYKAAVAPLLEKVTSGVKSER
jgi:hypothetical protein